MKQPNLKICFFGTYDKTYTSNQIVLKGLEENNFPVVEVNSEVKLTKLDQKEHMGWLQIMVRILKKYRILVEIFKNLDALKQCEVIYVGFPGHVDVFLAYLVAKILGKKLVFNPIVIILTGFVDDQGILKSNSLLGRAIRVAEKIVYMLPDLVIADTPEQKKHLMKLFGIPDKKIKALPLGADSDYYRHTPFKVKKPFNAVYYGLYTPLHGVEHIIECANILKEEKEIRFTLVGQGHMFEENFERAKRLKLSNIEFFHHIPVEKHPAIIEKADVFFGFLQNHPSVERIIPNKVYQGLALGKAVVAADSAVMRSVFTHKKNVYLCKAGSPKDLARAILKLRDDVALRKTIAENGYKLYVEKFTPKAVGKQLTQFIQEIL